MRQLFWGAVLFFQAACIAHSGTDDNASIRPRNEPPYRIFPPEDFENLGLVTTVYDYNLWSQVHKRKYIVEKRYSILKISPLLWCA